MAHRLRELKAPLVDPNRENLHTKLATKGTLLKQPTLPTRRPALGELGNRITSTTLITNKLLKPVETKKPVLKRVDSLVSTKPVAKPEPQISLIRPTAYSTKQIESDIVNEEETSSDPCQVSEYVQDIYRYLHELEAKYPVKAGFMQGHQSTPKMRTVLVNWLIQVHANFKMCLEVLHMTVSIIDRYLQLNATIDRKNLQLLGISALFVACKYEETYWPDISDFVYVTDETCSVRQIMAMERSILKRLEFGLGKPLSVHFLRRYSKVAQVSREYHTLSKYILELALLEDSLSHYNPSLLAAAACCLSIAVLDENINLTKIWNRRLECATTYKYEDLKPVLVRFAALMVKTDTTKYAVVRDKYASGVYHKISLNDKLKGRVIKKWAIHSTPSVQKQ